jgi:hypothetical protein
LKEEHYYADAYILGVLGVTVSLVFGAWGVVLMLRRQYPGEISFVRESCIGLFEAIIRNLLDLSVLFAACLTTDVKTGPYDIDSRGSFGD